MVALLEHVSHVVCDTWARVDARTAGRPQPVDRRLIQTSPAVRAATVSSPAGENLPTTRRSGSAETAMSGAAASGDAAIPALSFLARRPPRSGVWPYHPRATNPGVPPRTCSTRSCRRTSRRFWPRPPACGRARACPDSSRGSNVTASDAATNYPASNRPAPAAPSRSGR